MDAGAAPMPQGLYPMTVGDFNKDGIPDLLAGLYILLGNGNGSFQRTAVLSEAGSGAIEDFTGDGNPDVAITNSAGVFVFPGNGDGTFGPPVGFLAGFTPLIRLRVRRRATSTGTASLTWRW